MKEIEYSFIRAEKNNDIVVFIKVEPDWLNQEVFFGIQDKKITVKLPNEEVYVSKNLEPMLVERFESISTPIVFTDQEGNFLAEMNLSPINKSKVKP